MEHLSHFYIHSSLKPLLISFMDPDAAESLRQCRDKLSHDLTDVINEFGPKVFPDFDGKQKMISRVCLILTFRYIADYISRTTTPSTTPSTPSLARTLSSGSFGYFSVAPAKIPKIASGFFQQAARMGLDDKNLFNWGRAEESDADDVHIFGRSRSGSESEGSTPSRRSQYSSNGASMVMLDGIRLDGMTSLQKPRQRTKFQIEDEDEPKRKLEDEGYAGDHDDEGRSLLSDKKTM